MKVVVAVDGWGGSLRADEAAAAIAAGWQQARPADEVRTLPLSDGGEGVAEVVARDDDRLLSVEAAGPRGLPVMADIRLRSDRTAVIESASACGLALLPVDQRDPLLTTTWGVGQLLDAARSAGARRILLGLGGSATVDGGAGALAALGFRLRVDDGSGLKIGGGELHRIDRIEPGWVADWSDTEVVLLTDVRTTLADAAARFGPQKGADAAGVRWLETGLQRWADVVERDLTTPTSDPDTRLRDVAGSGAAGGLGYGLAAGIGARFVPGAAAVADLVGFDAALEGAGLVLTGEGRLDATTAQGKVVAYVADAARRRGIDVAAVVGAVGDPQVADELGLRAVAEASPEGPGEDPVADATRAARVLAGGWA